MVAGAVVLAAASLAVFIMLLCSGVGSVSAASGVGVSAVPRILFTRNGENHRSEGSIVDGFDHNEGDDTEDEGKEDEHESFHGMLNKTHGHYRNHMKKHAARYALSFVFQTALMFGVAWIYRRFGPACLPQESMPDHDPEIGRVVFAYGLFDEKEFWSEDLMLCMCSWFCTGIQWANNVSKPKIGIFGSFWVALMVSVLNSYELNALTHGVCYLFWILVAVYGRQRLREKYGLQHGSVITLVQDIIVWCCCCRCATAQEGRQVEHVRILDTRSTPFGEATQLQVDDEHEPPSSRRTLLRPVEGGMGRENTANTDFTEASGL